MSHSCFMLLRRLFSCRYAQLARPSFAIGIAACWLILQVSVSAQEAAGSKTAIAELQTVAESSHFQATARGSQVESFLRRVDAAWDSANLEALGQTVEGRAIWGLVVQPAEKVPTKPITVLVLGGIHAGECDGKEAILALARDLAAGRPLGNREVFDGSRLRLILVPNFNADGAERIGRLHRPGQAGPADGMGIRENAQGLDLNRDFVKLESPETRSLVAALNKYDVDILIDTHTTNGSLHRYDLTYSVPNNAIAEGGLIQWSRRSLLPQVSARMEQSGFATFYYGNFDAEHRQWTTFGYEPRYSTEYMGLRGRLGILLESYAYATYQRRFESTYAFLWELLRSIAANEVHLREIIDRQDRANSTDTSHSLPIRSQLAKSASPVTVKGYAHLDQTPPRPPFAPAAVQQLQSRDYQVELWNHATATKEIALPAAYAVPDQYAWALSRLAMHGVRLERLIEPETVSAEVLAIDKLESTPNPVHGHRMRTVTAKPLQREMQLNSGTYIVRTRQPLGKLAAYLLEPEADDSLARWNFFDPDLQAGNNYPVVRLQQTDFRQPTRTVQEVARGEQLSLERLMKPGSITDYGGERSSELRWIGKTGEYLTRHHQHWIAVDAATGSQRPFEQIQRLEKALDALDAFSSAEAAQAATLDAFTKDFRFALVNHRHDLYFFDAQNGAARRITHTPEKLEELSELSPTGRHAAFVQQNNLWIVDCDSTEVKQITHDGSVENLNGILDWVYQEELYGRGNFKGFWWSADGNRIAMMQLDQSKVDHYRVGDSIHFRQTLEDTRYPKAGDPLPVARLFNVDVPSGLKREVRLPGFSDDDRLIVRVTWSPSHQLWVQVQNRIQNRQVLYCVDSDSDQGRSVLSEKSEKWLEVLGVPTFLPSGDFLWLSDLPDGRRHLHLVSSKDGTSRPLTSGTWDVGELLGVSPDGNRAWVSGNLAHPVENHLIAVDIGAQRFHQVTQARGSHRTSVDPSGRFFVDSHSQLEEPTVTSVRSIDGTLLQIVNAPVSDRHRYVDLADPKLLSIEARDGLQLAAMVMLPSGVASGRVTEKLPVLFYVYGGPGAPTVSDAWQGRNYWWHQMLCQQGFAVVLCDNRSARGRGIQDTWQIHRDMGRIELQDLEDAARWVARQPWADAERIGVWGWSYGGYFTAYALTHSKLFKAGIAGAPVTDWHNYDAIYTERYMGLPQDNQQGYQSSSTVTAADRLHGRLLLIHGERDDNVHMSNTLQLAYALQKSGKPFDLMIYPKNRHGIVDASQRFHMHRLMTDFLQEHLKGDSKSN